jgi:hypothetical protein
LQGRRRARERKSDLPNTFSNEHASDGMPANAKNHGNQRKLELDSELQLATSKENKLQGARKTIFAIWLKPEIADCIIF